MLREVILHIPIVLVSEVAMLLGFGLMLGLHMQPFKPDIKHPKLEQAMMVGFLAVFFIFLQTICVYELVTDIRSNIAGRIEVPKLTRGVFLVKTVHEQTSNEGVFIVVLKDNKSGKETEFQEEFDLKNLAWLRLRTGDIVRLTLPTYGDDADRNTLVPTSY